MLCGMLGCPTPLYWSKMEDSTQIAGRRANEFAGEKLLLEVTVPPVTGEVTYDTLMLPGERSHQCAPFSVSALKLFFANCVLVWT